MKQFLLAFFCFVSLSTTTLAQAPAAAEQPEISFATEVYDFGTLKQGAECQTAFVFTNTGNAPLIISKAQASCGCTIPKRCYSTRKICSNQSQIRFKQGGYF